VRNTPAGRIAPGKDLQCLVENSVEVGLQRNL